MPKREKTRKEKRFSFVTPWNEDVFVSLQESFSNCEQSEEFDDVWESDVEENYPGYESIEDILLEI